MADDWGDFEAAESPAPSASLAKGDAILYKTRDGAWVPGKVVSIDLTIQPPSYCIEIDGNLRETEEWRLKKPETSTAAAAALPQTPVQLSAQPAAAPVALQFSDIDGIDAGEEEEDDFGDFSEAIDLPTPPTAAAAVFAAPVAIDPLSDPLSGAFGSPQGSPRGSPLGSPASARAPPRGALSPAEGSFRRFLAAAAPEVALQLDQEDSAGSLGDGAIAATGKKDESVPAAGLPHGFGSTTFLAEAAAAENGHVGTQEENDDWDDDFGDFEAAAVPETAAAPPPLPAAPLATAAVAENGGSYEAEPPAPVVPQPPPSALLRMLGPSSPTKAPAPAPPTGAPGAVQEYGVAWAMMLTAAAERLEAGRGAWAAAAAVIPPGTDADAAIDVRSQLLDIPRAQRYFAAVGRVFFVAGAVRLAADALGLLRFVPEIGTAWGCCLAAWGSAGVGEGGAETLGWAAREAAAQLGLPLAAELGLLDDAAAALPGMSLDDFPRMLAWSEGLDAFTLLPLAAFGESVPRVAWTGGREALAPVANFWLGCVSKVAPDLE